MRTAYDIIKKPVVTEKSMDGTKGKAYTFIVATDANKIEIKTAVEEIFNVEVLSVNTMNIKGKLKRVGVHKDRKSVV